MLPPQFECFFVADMDDQFFDGFLKGDELRCSLFFASEDTTVAFLLDFKSMYELLYGISNSQESEVFHSGDWEIFREGTYLSLQLGKSYLSVKKESDVTDFEEVIKKIRAEKDLYDTIAERYLREFGTY